MTDLAIFLRGSQTYTRAVFLSSSMSNASMEKHKSNNFYLLIRERDLFLGSPKTSLRRNSRPLLLLLQ